ncbi:hypothetical protein [Methylobacterium sp. A54F]
MAKPSVDPGRIVAPPIDMAALAEAVERYLAEPATGLHRIGAGFSLDLAATVAADPATCALLAQPSLSLAEKRRILTGLFLTHLLMGRAPFP